MQGSNEASLYTYKQTLLYLCASYNYASDLGRTDSARSFDRDPSKSLGLYTLGRIFEQSITELEILEAQADGRPSINKLSKRKRDGVYYTPEGIVELIVDETLGPRLAEIKRECGWSATDDPSPQAIETYAARLKSLTVLDPACGSGAFLITALRNLVEEWHQVQRLRRKLTRGLAERDDEATLIAEIPRDNIYGVDINSASMPAPRRSAATNEYQTNFSGSYHKCRRDLSPEAPRPGPLPLHAKRRACGPALRSRNRGRADEAAGLRHGGEALRRPRNRDLLLFPYGVSESRVTLIDVPTMQTNYPKA